MTSIFRFTMVALVLMSPIAVLAVDIPTGVTASSENLLPPKQDVVERGVAVSDFIPNSREYDWHAASLVKPPVPMSPKEPSAETPWLMFAALGLTGGIGSYWLGRRRGGAGVADDHFSERRRVIATKQVFVSVPDLPKVIANTNSAAPATSEPATSGSFDLYLDRAALLAGKTSGPDTGRW